MNLDLLILFEDAGWSRLWPLTATRPTYDLRVGAHRMWEKQRDAFAPRVGVAAAVAAEGRRAVTGAFAAANGIAVMPQEVRAKEDVLWWNGAVLPPAGPLPGLPSGTEGVRFISGERRVVGLCHAAGNPVIAAVDTLLDGAHELPSGWTEEVLEVESLESLWDLVTHLESELQADLARMFAAATMAARPTDVHLLGERLVLGEGAVIEAGAVLDCRPGPIWIEAGARVESLTHLVGPAYVGAGTQLLGGRVSVVSLGKECRVGGEVDTVVFQGFGNKRHQGFLGHAVVGEWVNIGAMTANSDLKNNYGTVRVWIEGREEDSGQRKIGCFLGDHVKTGIGSLLTTGCVVGPGSNLFGGGRIAPRFLPGWSWWNGQETVVHEWEKFLATARISMSRRGEQLEARQEAALAEALASEPAMEGLQGAR